MKKRSFLLLEVLIAVFLIALCSVPLIVQPLQMYRAEIALLWEIEGERLADWTFSEIKEKLLKNEIPWKKLPEFEKQSAPFSLADATVSLPGGKKKVIQRSFTLLCKKEKEDTNGEISRFFEIKIHFTPKLAKKEEKYSFNLSARKLLEENKKQKA